MFAEGPRQVINALTLYSVMQANLVPVGEHAPEKGGSSVAQFFINIRILASHHKEQAATLFGMLFTLLVWAIAALSLILAALCYILFLWHYIPTADDGLSGYCRRKVDSRLRKIVGVKVKKALAIDFSPRPGNTSKAVRDGASPARVTRQPTFPMLDLDAEDKRKEPPISRRTTETTLPPYSLNANDENRGRSKQGARAELVIPYLPPFQNRPAPFSRTTTNSSATSDRSYASNAPLLRAAEEMGYGPSLDSRLTAASFGPSSGRQHLPSIERNLADNPNNTQHTHYPAFRSPRLKSRNNTPGVMLAENSSLQKPRQSEFSSSGTQFRSTQEDDYFGAAQEIPPLDHSGERVAIPEHQPAGNQDSGVHHPRPTTGQIDRSRSNNAYVAFNPHLRTGFVPRKPATTQTRNFTMPFNRPPQPTPQPQTVPNHSRPALNSPPPARITRNPTWHPHSESPPSTSLPARAATRGPGTPAWDASKMFH